MRSSAPSPTASGGEIKTFVPVRACLPPSAFLMLVFFFLLFRLGSVTLFDFLLLALAAPASLSLSLSFVPAFFLLLLPLLVPAPAAGVPFGAVSM